MKYIKDNCQQSASSTFKTLKWSLFLFKKEFLYEEGSDTDEI